MRRKEPDERSNGAKNGILGGKVSKKGIAMHCSVCRSKEQYKRFHGKQENNVNQYQKHARRNKNVGQGSVLHSISLPHTVQWMTNGTCRYPNISSPNVSIPSERFHVIDANSTNQVQNVERERSTNHDDSSSRKIWMSPGQNYGDASFIEESTI